MRIPTCRVSPVSHVTAALLLALLASACGGEDAPAEQANHVVDGQVAHGYAEAVHVNRIDEYGPAGGCSGVLVAPKVVVTAAHCIEGYRAWGIYAPFAGGQGQMAHEAAVYDWYDWKAAGHEYPWERHDVGVILLDEPIELEAYPRIADAPVADGDWITIVGRVKNGFNSPDWLFESDPVVALHEWLSKPEATGRYYTVPEVTIERGDSGGPVYPHDPEASPDEPRTLIGIVATVHGVYRLENTRDWVQTFIDAP